MPGILSTKKLSTNQKELLLNAGIAFVEYNAIKIDFLNFSTEQSNFRNVIITSKNAVKAIINRKLQVENCFCVGEKTAEVLRKNGFSITKSADYGIDLARVIIENYPEEHFTFFCGNKRRKELPTALKQNNISFREVEVYKTKLNPQKFDQEFDGILFFSPSAVKSYTRNNSLKNSIAFCIGKTTASEAKKHTKNIHIATKLSIENVIVQVVKKLKKKS